MFSKPQALGLRALLATVALAAKYEALAVVVLGTTLGMMIANVPAVLLGEAAAQRLPVRTLRAVAAALFAALGLAVLTGMRLGL
ncbi:membrane protein [Sulfurifustis variabilis]|uniref:GDT1 family protein n=1 Tax=Sulfurifustis variabilis TaxID=1675686 RepID=A0A1B4V800_9GAMM|nr:TMEM165/GDT1 family protein [Sulfurifustis variabilis]BAU49653.1 membrane protein [Sulfurifustis variabilis]